MSRFKLLKFVSQLISVNTLRRIFSFTDHYVAGLFRSLNSGHLFLSAAGIAFSIIISAIPLVLLIFSVLGSIIDPSTIEEQVNTAIDEIIPFHASALYMKRFILSRIPEVVEYKSLAGWIGSFGLFFTSTWLFSSMRTILNKIFKVEEVKSAVVGMLRDFGMVIMILIFILLSTFILPVMNFFVSLTEEIEVLKQFNLGALVGDLVTYLSIVLMLIMFYLFYLFIPYGKLGHRVAMVGALWATILWELVRLIFEYYVVNFLALNKLYGTFLFFAVVMFWIFYASIVFLLGAEVGQLYRERREIRNSIP
ncbi:MAG: YihY/virulence factor BrkB family protein, partial [Bacteroidota bacterium]